jgi:hypothetical protein
VVKKNNERYVSILALFSCTKQPKEPIQRTKPKTIFLKKIKKKCLPFVLKTDTP